VNGGINLAILQLFQSDIVAQGNAVVNASVTGSLRDPQVNGRLELHGASLYLGDIPVGVDNANGLIAFDRSRANIEKLTAEVGGGKVAFGGFVGFNAGTLLYRVQASADQVRIRYPEGVSTTLTAALDLTGSSQNSLVSGTITIVRAGFTPKADVGSLLAATAKPISAPVAPNEYLRNIQLDVRIESGPSLQFQTSLTRDLEAEVDLRLRGNAARPTLIGEVSVNEGEVNVFGNKYTINRGEIRFTNPTRIEPVFDVDLETKARGITVNISFTGTLNRINLTYRSDPPLQSSEIVALLAVGRDPTTSAGLASGQVAQNSFLESGSGVIGQALSTPVTSRLQRFFGVTRLKIDPQLTGVENIPQARLTLEQQVSRDITLTYITNLTRTQEQIVRIQWDISRQWSAIAVREENGVFGVDFQYRKRFK
jgi:translocation and assembly module TamB